MICTGDSICLLASKGLCFLSVLEIMPNDTSFFTFKGGCEW